MSNFLRPARYLSRQAAKKRGCLRELCPALPVGQSSAELKGLFGLGAEVSLVRGKVLCARQQYGCGHIATWAARYVACWTGSLHTLVNHENVAIPLGSISICTGIEQERDSVDK